MSIDAPRLEVWVKIFLQSVFRVSMLAANPATMKEASARSAKMNFMFVDLEAVLDEVYSKVGHASYTPGIKWIFSLNIFSDL